MYILGGACTSRSILFLVWFAICMTSDMHASTNEDTGHVDNGLAVAASLLFAYTHASIISSCMHVRPFDALHAD